MRGNSGHIPHPLPHKQTLPHATDSQHIVAAGCSVNIKCYISGLVPERARNYIGIFQSVTVMARTYAACRLATRRACTLFATASGKTRTNMALHTFQMGSTIFHLGLYARE